jgi:type II secretory pathway component PulF
MMKRILMVLTVAALMVAMMALSAVPSFAQVSAEDDQETESGDVVAFAVAGAN